MATLLKLDSKIINLDHVFEINDYGDRVGVYYAVTSCDTAGIQQPAYTELDGTAAEALRRWLVRHAINLLAPHESAQATQPAPAIDAEAERVRQLGTNEAAANASPADDGTFYGAARIQQMSGAGSDIPRDTGRRRRTRTS